MESIQEELKRFNAIYNYGKKFIVEQEPPLPQPAGVTPPAGAEAAPADPTAAAPADATGLGAETAPPTDAKEFDPEADAEAEAEVAPDEGADDTTEEIDITDLVNMTKSIKKQLDTTQGQDDTQVTQKMDDVFSKLGELEGKLSEMDGILAKIDQLGSKIEQMKPKTPVEKLEMRTLDSYPFNVKPGEFFDGKQDEMRTSGKNEYVLTKGDVENYGRNEIMKSFNPKADENNYNI